MLKNILNTEGAQALTKAEQKSIKGSGRSCVPGAPNQGCLTGECCSYGTCYKIGTAGHPCTMDPINP